MRAGQPEQPAAVGGVPAGGGAAAARLGRPPGSPALGVHPHYTASAVASSCCAIRSRRQLRDRVVPACLACGKLLVQPQRPGCFVTRSAGDGRQPVRDGLAGLGGDRAAGVPRVRDEVHRELDTRACCWSQACCPARRSRSPPSPSASTATACYTCRSCPSAWRFARGAGPALHAPATRLATRGVAAPLNSVYSDKHTCIQAPCGSTVQQLLCMRAHA